MATERLFFYLQGDSHVTETTILSYCFDREYDPIFSSHIFLQIIRVNQFYEVIDSRLPVYKASEEDILSEESCRDFDNRLKVALSPDIDSIVEPFENSEILVFYLRPRSQ